MFATLKTKLKGYRTLIGSAALGGVGLANVAGGVDLKPVVQMFVSDEHKLAVAMIGIAIFFGVMRLMTNGPVGVPTPGQPVKNVDDGD